MAVRQSLAPEEAVRKIQLILEQGTTEFSVHARKQMRKRGASAQDVLHALLTGQILRKPEWDKEHNEWKYRVEGVDLEGDELTAITVIFDADLSLLVVTVFG